MKHPSISHQFRSRNLNQILRLLILCVFLAQASCAGHTKTIVGGMLAGGAVGAGVGYQFVHHGDNKQYEDENTIISAIVFALITGGVLTWHYEELRQAKVDMSGQYARYRLCDPEDMNSKLAEKLQLGNQDSGSIYKLGASQIGKNALTLDDQTKWVYPTFRKRYLQPERNEDQVISRRYLWEIVRSGRFVTRSQDPEYFGQQENSQKENSQNPSPSTDQEDKNKEKENNETKKQTSDVLKTSDFSRSFSPLNRSASCMWDS